MDALTPKRGLLSELRGRGAGELPLPASAAERPRIVAVLNAYAPDGRNAGQATVRADGAVTFYNEESLLRPALAALRSIDLRRFGNRRR